MESKKKKLLIGICICFVALIIGLMLLVGLL